MIGDALPRCSIVWPTAGCTAECQAETSNHMSPWRCAGPSTLRARRTSDHTRRSEHRRHGVQAISCVRDVLESDLDLGACLQDRAAVGRTDGHPIAHETERGCRHAALESERAHARGSAVAHQRMSLSECGEQATAAAHTHARRIGRRMAFPPEERHSSAVGHGRAGIVDRDRHFTRRSRAACPRLLPSAVFFGEEGFSFVPQ